MKEKWIEEQQTGYEKLICMLKEIKCSKKEIKHLLIAKITCDLKEAIEWINSNDYDTGYRFAGGAVKALKDNEVEYFLNDN